MGDNVGEWIRQWEAMMAARGYPYAQLRLTLHNDQVQYTWEYDVNAIYHHWLSHGEHPHDENAWGHAHECLMAVDHLRPDLVSRSIALQRLFNERQEMN